jgi:tRNA dimethylallyltransferase
MSFFKNLKDKIKEVVLGPKIVFIIGPTASGKTSFSIEYAKKNRNCEIISCDSRQIYKDFDLLTGKVTEEEMSGIPHHLLNIINPGEKFTVENYTKFALEKIKEIQKRGNTPVFVGGTGFYVDNILFNYNLPSVPPNKELRQKIESLPLNEVYEMLREIDPEYAEREAINKNNKHRMQRAYEIAYTLGKIPPLNKTKRFKNVEIIYIEIPKEKLHENIYKRLIQRLDDGMIEELVFVKEKYNLSFEYLESLGLEFKYISYFLQDKITKEEMIQELFEAIKKYAKRQIVWFRRYKNF